MQSLFHWIYCLPLDQAVLWALCATSLFLWLRQRLEGQKWWRFVLMAALMVWLVAVVRTCLTTRTSGVFQWNLLPLKSYITVLQGGNPELVRSNFMNVLLFYPGGLVSASLWRRSKLWKLTGLFFLLSLLIELTQFVFCLGFAEIDDVIHNTLGGWLGLLTSKQFERLTQKTGTF
ncbi:MAG: VanZ family protein [Oscillospiraceae bacterium]|nr:VanZ family protein [Oscillospiraceae bacterium]